jgi:hypothetical protein
MTAFRTQAQDTPTTGRWNTTESTGTEDGNPRGTIRSRPLEMGTRHPRGSVRRALA